MKLRAYPETVWKLVMHAKNCVENEASGWVLNSVISVLSAFTWLSLIVHSQAQSPEAYNAPFVDDAAYDQTLPKPDDLLGYVLGSRAATAGEVEKCIKAWSAASDKAQLIEYARSHEDRPLHYVIVSAPANLRRLEAIKRNLSRLGDPRGLSDPEIEQLIAETPPVAWLAYTIHGDETEGSDAALAVLYHLLADTDERTRSWLRDAVIIIDPLMNPDGRDRFLKMVAEHRGTLPNYDDRPAVHTGYWPFGRGNHYLFDLNRDWILAAHPETRGRIQALGQWNPLLLVDAHGMGSQETHLFSPPRAPINPNIPQHRLKWGAVFASDQAQQFDQQGWLYYNGEWFEDWYPGYSDSWSSYRGAIGILYEQARVAENGVRRPGGRVLSYRESVHHHVVGSLANLDTFYRNRLDLWKGFVATRREASDPNGPYANRLFAVPPTPNKDRWERFVDLMALQGFEMHRTESVVRVPNAIDQLGRRVSNIQLPAGSLLLSNRQPLGHLLAAMLEFDTRLSDAVLKDERKEVWFIRLKRIVVRKTRDFGPAGSPLGQQQKGPPLAVSALASTLKDRANGSMRGRRRKGLGQPIGATQLAPINLHFLCHNTLNPDEPEGLGTGRIEGLRHDGLESHHDVRSPGLHAAHGTPAFGDGLRLCEAAGNVVARPQ